ncbi:MAG: leucyl aminopeptidase family protein, partial [Deltaproteobacteria bacterium]|nr:leucyl aminopeptidase family protein [Deltaproteobacteria bacterium]
DAEGRLILNDSLTLACEDKPKLVIDFATLTGAARVALGTELPAMFCTDPLDAEEVRLAIGRHQLDPDPMWHMPLFEPYRRHLRSYIADVHNIDNVGTGGAITAALFLREFVDSKVPWIHIDTMAWNLRAQPGRPEGGEVFGVRTLYRMLRERFG